MNTKLWFDSETYSEVPIKHGTYKYTSNCEILLLPYAIDDGAPVVIDYVNGEPLTPELEDALLDPSVDVWAQNSMFDRSVLRYQLPEFCPPITRWRDTLIQAYEHSLPGSLSKLCEVLGIPADKAKDKRGTDLIHLFCKPRPKNSKLRRATRDTHPEEWAEFVEYARQDIVSLREVHSRLPTYNYPKDPELSHWHLDQLINDRGFQVDMDLVRGAIQAVKEEQAELRDQILDATDGEVTSATKSAALLHHILESYGIILPNLQKGVLERVLGDDDIPEPVKELIRIRLQATASSTSKYTSLLRAVNEDDRCRGTIQFAGAKRTARAAGRTFQPQNLPSRGLLPKGEIEYGINCIKDGDIPDLFFDNKMKLLASAVRGILVAPPGKKLVVSDLSNIEGRKAAWFAGEEWKLKAFRELDAGTGPDLYNLAYAKSFQVPVESVDSAQRSIGKVQELMLGYAGGVGAFVTGALGYGFDIEALAKNIWHTLPDETVREARDFYEWMQKRKAKTYGLSEEAFIACDVLKRLWREANSNIAALWKVLELAVIRAIRNPGDVISAGAHLKVKRTKNWLLIRLPSGRYLTYPAPRIDENDKISYMGDNQYTRRWERISTHGGKLLENICQASGRDTLYGRFPDMEEAGYNVVLHVHDEAVTEVPDTKDFTAEELSRIMSSPFEWSTGLPLAAAGFEAYRYRK